MFLCFYLVVILVPFAKCLPQAYYRDLTGLSSEEKALTKQKYLASLDLCSARGDFMPYFNKTLGKYECYQILERGPCKGNEWFVLDPELAEAEIPFARCLSIPCNGNQDLVQVQGSETCVVIKDDSVCEKGAHIMPNPYGLGEILKSNSSKTSIAFNY